MYKFLAALALLLVVSQAEAQNEPALHITHTEEGFTIELSEVLKAKDHRGSVLLIIVDERFKLVETLEPVALDKFPFTYHWVETESVTVHITLPLKDSTTEFHSEHVMKPEVLTAKTE